MTFSETKELLQWARNSRVAHLKCGTDGPNDIVEVTFYPDKDTPPLSSTGGKPEGWEKWVDKEFGLEGIDDPVPTRTEVREEKLP